MVIDSAIVGPAASLAAHSSTSGVEVAAGTTRFTRPIANASVADRAAPRRTPAPSPGAGRRAAASTQLPPPSIDIPRFEKISMKRASSDATIEVAPERHVRAHPRGHTADLGDGGLGQAVQREDEIADVAHRGQPVGDRRLAQVGTRAEVATRAGEHQHPVVAAARPSR